jgi:hypothetical protein
MAVAAPSKLPLWRTIGQAYAVWGRNFSELVRISWLWMLVIAPLLAILMWWQEAQVVSTIEAARIGQRFVDPDPLLALVRQIAGQLVMLPALASVAVAWHRLLLRDEHPGPGLYLRRDRVVLLYAILAFWIGLITLAPGYVRTLFQMVTGISAADSVVQPVANLAAIIALFIVARLSLALPGMALGREDVTLRAAWEVSRRNTWRMFWAYFACILPWAAIIGVVTYLMFRSDHSRAAGTLLLLVTGLLWIPFGMISVGMLSLAYRHFFERRV